MPEPLTDAEVLATGRLFARALQEVVEHGWGSVRVEVVDGKPRLIELTKSRLVRPYVPTVEAAKARGHQDR